MLIVELLESQIISKAQVFDPRVLGGEFRPFFWINAAESFTLMGAFLRTASTSHILVKVQHDRRKRWTFHPTTFPPSISQGAREPRHSLSPFVDEKGRRADCHSLASCAAMRPPVLQPHSRGRHDNREANLLADRTCERWGGLHRSVPLRSVCVCL